MSKKRKGDLRVRTRVIKLGFLAQGRANHISCRLLMWKKRWILIAAVLLISAALDQWTKHWARQTLRGHPPLVLVNNYLAFEYHENPGMAFGLARDIPGARFFFIGVGAIVLVFVWRTVRQMNRCQRWADISFGLIAGGAIGNLIDRIFIGRVTDL